MVPGWRGRFWPKIPIFRKNRFFDGFFEGFLRIPYFSPPVRQLRRSETPKNRSSCGNILAPQLVHYFWGKIGNLKYKIGLTLAGGADFGPKSQFFEKIDFLTRFSEFFGQLRIFPHNYTSSGGQKTQKPEPFVKNCLPLSVGNILAKNRYFQI